MEAEVEIFSKNCDLCLKTQSLETAWLRDLWRSGDANRVFIWGRDARQTTPYKRERLATILLEK